MLSFSTCLYPQALCISQVSPNRTCSMEIYYEDLAHVSVEAKKSHYLLSASWTPRKGGVISPHGNSMNKIVVRMRLKTSYSEGWKC